MDKIRKEIVEIFKSNNFDLIKEQSYGSIWSNDFEYYAILKHHSGINVELEFTETLKSLIANIDYNINRSNNTITADLSKIKNALIEFQENNEMQKNKSGNIKALYTVSER